MHVARFSWLVLIPLYNSFLRSTPADLLLLSRKSGGSILTWRFYLKKFSLLATHGSVAQLSSNSRSINFAHVTSLVMDYIKMFVFFVLIVNIFSVHISASPVVSEDLELLKRQVETLITYREQDYNSLATALRQSVEKNEVVVNLKSEIQNLR